MVEAAGAGSELAQAVKAKPAVARVNGLAAGFPLQEIYLLQVRDGGPAGRASGHGSAGNGANLIWQADLDYMTGWAALDQTQRALGNEAAHGLDRGRAGDVSRAGQLPKRKAELGLPCEAAKPQEMGVDHALGEIQAQPRDEILFELFPEISLPNP